MATDSGYKSKLGDDSSQSSASDQKQSQEMRRYSGVLSVYGEQQWFTMNAVLSAHGERGNTLAIYKKTPENGQCNYHVTIDMNKVCGMLTPEMGKTDGLHILMLFTNDKQCHLVSALSAVERDNWARELAQTIGKGHSFPVTLPAQNLFGQKEAILHYNNVNKNLLVISKPDHNVMDKCSLLALWNMSEVKSFGASGSKLVIQTKKSTSQGACHLSFQTPQARRIIHLLQNKCEEGCSCCCKPHPFSQMANNLSDSSNGSSSDSDDEISLVHVQLYSKSLQRLDDIDLTPKTINSGRKTPEPTSSHKLLKKRAATIDTRLSGMDDDDGKNKDTLLQSFLFSPQHMNKFNSESGISPTRVSRTMKPQKSLPLLDSSNYEEIKPVVSSPASKQSLYEEIPDDFRKAAVAYRGSWGGKQLSQEIVPQETEKTPHAFYREGSMYEAMNRQEQVPNPQASQLNSEDSYVCMHSLSNRSSSLSLKPVASDGQLTTNHNSSIPLYMNTTNHRNSSPLAYANLADVQDMGSTGNLAYVEISGDIIPSSRRSAERSLSPETSTIPYAEIDHNLTEALRKTTAQRRPVCRAQTLDTAEHKKTHKKWLAKLTAKRT